MDIEQFKDCAERRNVPWNKGKLTGAKPPLRPKHVWAIRTRLQIGGRIRDLALFNLAIDSKLRGCDLVSLKVEDVAPHGYAIDRATIRQGKPAGPSNLKSLNRLARQSTIISQLQDRLQVSICSKDDATIAI